MEYEAPHPFMEVFRRIHGSMGPFTPRGTQLLHIYPNLINQVFVGCIEWKSLLKNPLLIQSDFDYPKPAFEQHISLTESWLISFTFLEKVHALWIERGWSYIDSWQSPVLDGKKLRLISIVRWDRSLPKCCCSGKESPRSNILCHVPNSMDHTGALE